MVGRPTVANTRLVHSANCRPSWTANTYQTGGEHHIGRTLLPSAATSHRDYLLPSHAPLNAQHQASTLSACFGLPVLLLASQPRLPLYLGTSSCGCIMVLVPVPATCWNLFPGVASGRCLLTVAQRPLAPSGLCFSACHMAALAAQDTLYEARDLRLHPSWSSRPLRALASRLA